MRTAAITCFSPVAGTRASLTCPGSGAAGAGEGRTAEDAAYWLAQAAGSWRDAVEIVAIGTCSIYASAVRRMPPAARLVVDLFHVVQLAVKITGDVRRRAVREKYARRGRSGDAEYGVKGLLVRNLGHLSPAQLAQVMDTLGADRHGQEIAAAWIAKEKLRDVLNLRARVTRSVPCERAVRGGWPLSMTGPRKTTTSPSCSPWPGQYQGGRTRSPQQCSRG
jgi:hypothetical protein